MRQYVWLYNKRKIHHISVMTVCLLLVLQPVVTIFASQTALALETPETSTAVEIKAPLLDSSQKNNRQSQASVLDTPANGHPHNVLQPTTDFDFTWDPVQSESGQSVTYEFRISSGLTSENELDSATTENFVTAEPKQPFMKTGTDAEKTWYWQVRAKAGDEESQWSSVWKVAIDTTAPTVVISQPSGVYGGPATSEIPFLAEGYDARGIKKCTVIQDEGTPVATDEPNTTGEVVNETEPVTQVTLTATVDAKSLPEGDHAMTVKIEDIAGNEGVASKSFVVDKTAPQLSTNIINNQIVKGTVDINLSVSDATPQTSSIKLLDENNAPVVQLNGLEKGEMTANTNNLRWDTTTMTDGIYHISFSGKDAAGNDSTLVRTVTVDNIVPGVGTTAPIHNEPVVDPLLDKLSKQLTQPFPAPQAYGLASPIFANATEKMDEEVVDLATPAAPETDRDARPVVVAPTENGWRILGILWYWWLLTIAGMSVVVFKWPFIWQATTLVLRK